MANSSGAAGDARLEKICFELGEDDLAGASAETMWAENLGNGLFRLRNSPFHVYGVSFEDVVLTRSVAGRLPEFVSVHRHSGRSTYRIILERDVDAGRFRDYWTPLERLGCSYEHASGRYYAIDVPEDSDIHAVYALLEKGVADNVWDFEEGHRGHAA